MPRSHNLRVPSLLFVAGLMVSDGQSQSKIATCNKAPCEILLQKVATISDRDRPGLLKPYSVFVTQDRLGRLITSSRTSDKLVVFNKDGRLHSEIGAKGQFLLITSVLALPNDTILAYDTRRRTVTILDANLKIVRSADQARFRPALALQDDHFIVAQQIRTSRDAGYPLHVLNSKSQIVRSFGADPPVFRADQPLLSERVVAPGLNGTVWAVPHGRYVIERWNPDTGAKLNTVTVRSSWFKESVRPRNDETLRPTPLIEALWQTDNILLVLIRDADLQWKIPAAANIERPLDVEEYDATYDWVLDAIDIATGNVVASKRFSTAVWGRAPSLLLTTRQTTTTGGPLQFDVWMPQVKEKRQ